MSKLNTFLCLLLRDHLPFGKVEEIMRLVSDLDAKPEDENLSKYVQSLSELLTDAPSEQESKKPSELSLRQEFFDYMLPFCVSDEFCERLYDWLGLTEGAVVEFMEEHKRQATDSSFGIGGLMSSLNDSQVDSGINWYISEKGFDYWDNILGV